MGEKSGVQSCHCTYLISLPRILCSDDRVKSNTQFIMKVICMRDTSTGKSLGVDGANSTEWTKNASAQFSKVCRQKQWPFISVSSGHTRYHAEYISQKGFISTCATSYINSCFACLYGQFEEIEHDVSTTNCGTGDRRNPAAPEREIEMHKEWSVRSIANKLPKATPFSLPRLLFAAVGLTRL
jgi:hypothetical protein